MNELQSMEILSLFGGETMIQVTSPAPSSNPVETPSSASSSASSVLRRFTDVPIQSYSLLKEQASTSSSSDGTLHYHSSLPHKITSPEKVKINSTVRVQKTMLKELSPGEIQARISMLQESYMKSGENESLIRMNFESSPRSSVSTPSSENTKPPKNGSATSTVEIVDVEEQILEIISCGSSKSNLPESSISQSDELVSVTPVKNSCNSNSPRIEEKKEEIIEIHNEQDKLTEIAKNVISKQEVIKSFNDESHISHLNQNEILKSEVKSDRKYLLLEQNVKELTEKLQSLESSLRFLSEEKPKEREQKREDSTVDIARLNEKRLLVLEELQLEQTHLQRKLVNLLEGVEDLKFQVKDKPPLKHTCCKHVDLDKDIAEATPAPRPHNKVAPCVTSFRSDTEPCADLNVSDHGQNIHGNLLKHLIDAESGLKTPSKNITGRYEVHVSPLNLLEKVRHFQYPSPGIPEKSGEIVNAETYQLINDLHRIEIEKQRIESTLDGLKFKAFDDDIKAAPFTSFVPSSQTEKAKFRVKKVVNDIFEQQTKQVCSVQQVMTTSQQTSRQTRNIRQTSSQRLSVPKECRVRVQPNQASQRCPVDSVPLWKNRDYLSKVYGREFINKNRSTVRGRVKKADTQDVAPFTLGYSKIFQQSNTENETLDSTTTTMESTIIEVKSTVVTKTATQQVQDDDRVILLKPVQIFPNRQYVQPTEDDQPEISALNDSNIAALETPDFHELPQTKSPQRSETQEPNYHSTPAHNKVPRQKVNDKLEEELVQLLLKPKPKSEVEVSNVLAELMAEIVHERKMKTDGVKDTDKKENKVAIVEEVAAIRSNHTTVEDSWNIVETIKQDVPAGRPEKSSVAVETSPVTSVIHEDVAVETEATVTLENVQQTDQTILVSCGVATSPAIEEIVKSIPQVSTSTQVIAASNEFNGESSTGSTQHDRQEVLLSTEKKEEFAKKSLSASSLSSSNSSHQETSSSLEHTECSSVSVGQHLIDLSIGEIRPVGHTTKSTGLVCVDQVFSDDEGDIDFLEKMFANKVRQETGDSEDISQGQRMTESNDTGDPAIGDKNENTDYNYAEDFEDDET